MAMADASHAFTQSDYYHSSDRIAVILPKCVRACASEWLGGMYLGSPGLVVEDGKGAVRNLPVDEVNSHALLLYRPLYGTRDAPMRWYTKLSATLIKFKFPPPYGMTDAPSLAFAH